jgi:hypothetical protein
MPRKRVATTLIRRTVGQVARLTLERVERAAASEEERAYVESGDEERRIYEIVIRRVTAVLVVLSVLTC